MEKQAWAARLSHARRRAAESGQRQVLRGRWYPAVGWVYYCVPKGSITDFTLQSQREAQMHIWQVAGHG